MLRALRRYRSVPALAALAVLLGAFAPAPLLPCAPPAETPAPEEPPCHRVPVHEGSMNGSALEQAPPEAPPTRHVPPRPQPDLLCCPSKAPLAPTPEQPTSIATVVQVLDAVGLLVPASVPRAVVASDASPPGGASLHLLFGCFLI